MSVFTEDTWTASLDQVDRGPSFQVWESPHPPAHRMKREVLTTHAESSCCVVFSGVLYNRRELDLAASLPDPANDAARVARAYLRDPTTFIPAIQGIFAFVLWDSRSHTLLAVRDALGIFPLFYARTSRDRWLFSPTLGALLADASVSNRLDTMVLAEHLFDQWVSGEETEYQAIRRVLPGHVLGIHRNVVRTSRYWNPPPADLRGRAEDIDGRFERLLRQAVGRALGQGRAGIFLSGGVDSISVAAIAKDLTAAERAQPLPAALSLLYANPDGAEERLQRTVATMLGLPARQLDFQETLGRRTAIEWLLEANATWPTPMINLYLPPFLELARAGQAAGCEVILTGGGGDEWLGVSPYFAADLLGSLRLIDYGRFCRKIHRSYDIGYGGLLRLLGWTFGLKPHLARLRNTVASLVHIDVDRRNCESRVPRWIGPMATLRDAIKERYVIAARADRARRAQASTLYDYEARRTLDHPIVISEIENKFHSGQHVGVRMLEPYWDAQLIDLLYATSPEDLGLGGLAKGLVHRLVNRALPELPAIRQRKIASSRAYQARVRREGREAWRMMKGVPALAQLGIVDPDGVERTVQRLLADGDSAGVWLIPHLLSIEAWARTHG